MANKKLELAVDVVDVKREWCKACGICVEFCPKKCLQLNDNGYCEPIEGKECIQCHMCELRCPDYAILVKSKNKEVK